MREYKFRGKTGTTEGKKWVYGYYYKVKSFFCDKEGHFISVIRNDHLQDCNIDEDTLCQYTGEKDKNGAEIYEGDILRFSEVDTAIVEWNEKYSYFMVRPIQDYYFDSDVLGHALEYNDNVEVIGNKFDNPELLEKE